MRKTILMSSFALLLLVASFGCGGSASNGGGNNNQPRISVTPTTANLLVGQSTTLTANVQNVSDTHVSWAIQEEGGGTITATNSGAIYTAPWPVGTYHVTVTSAAEPSLRATATLSVSATFAFLEEYPAGDALPFSMTPKIGAFGPDGAFAVTSYIDQGTGNPLSVAMESVDLSADGTKATLDIATPDGMSDVYTANADATGDTVQLTTDGISWSPKFSADGQQIVYIRDYEIWAMGANGSNQNVVLPGNAGEIYAYSATFSPDGSKIAAELEWSPGGTYYDGIAIMNADGSSVVPLTGGLDFPCAIGWDEAPAFTHDGTQILFSRYCDDNVTETLYTINTDGTGLTPLYPAVETPGVLTYNPIPVADKFVFQSNEDTPYSIPQFDIYSIKPVDGGMLELSRLMTNSLYDGFDCNWYYSCGSASVQQSTQPLAKQAPRRLRTRAEKIRNQQQTHRR